MDRTGLSLIVCTRNRSALLEICLHSLLEQKDFTIEYEIIVADNNSNDNTAAVVAALQNNYPIIKYVSEKQIGLSYTRNTGMKTASYDFVGYIDDDGKVMTDLIKTAEQTIKNFNFDCFGGWFVPWYRTPKPKWLSPSFGLYPKWRDDPGLLNETQDNPGGIIFFKKKMLENCGGFPIEIGMRGNVIGYGEENFVQKKIREAGGTIGFNPGLVLEHLVAEYKYKLTWHLQRNIAKGRDAQIATGALKIKTRIFLFLKSIIFTIVLLVKHLPMLFSGNYYWQNYLLNSLAFFCQTVGRVSVKR